MEDNFTHKIPLVEKALEPIKEHFARTGPGRVSERIVGPIDGTCMLRLDWELVYEDDKELNVFLNDREKVVGLMLSFMATDLADLLVNGDVNQSHDALLKSFSGERIRGKEAVEVLIPHASYYQEVKPKKNSIEYTVFCRFGAKFEE